MPASAGVDDIASRLDAWRVQGADRIAPLRFHAIDALHRRAATREGETRRRLDARLVALADAYASLVGSAGHARDVAARPGTEAQASLGALVWRLTRDGPAREQARADAVDVADARDNAPAPAMPCPEPSPMAALVQARRAWAEARVRSQVRESLGQTAEDAGPLNSTRLVHRALSLMGDACPAYLDAFLGYLDTLAWLEPLGQHGGAAAEDAVRAPSPRKSTRKPRQPRTPRNRPAANGEAAQMALE